MKIHSLIIALWFLTTSQVQAFCGFYVAKADTSLFNKASQVVLVRDGQKTVISMMNDYQGKLKNFAMVVPVPTVLKKEQVNVGKKSLFNRIDSFTAPRLVEYYDDNPCIKKKMMKKGGLLGRFGARGEGVEYQNRPLGVKVEEEYTVGEYDIVVLSAKESNGLETWLRQNNYSIPKGASQALAPYIKQKMKFFVAKVNLEEQTKTGLTYLRPLQFAFDSEKFMLPIRLGMLNAQGPQELFVYVLTKNGRVETTNYQTVKLPTGMEIPTYVKDEFSDFYKSMFTEQVKREKMKAVFTEYFWDMSWCDPCAASPLTAAELRGLGVFWVNQNGGRQNKILNRPGFRPQGAQPVKVTRLHLRYTKETFPDDLMFHETGDTKNFQGRYILRHPWKGEASCEAATTYRKALPERLEKEAKSLANLTGWDINEIRKKLKMKGPAKQEVKKGSWWKNLWQKEG